MIKHGIAVIFVILATLLVGCAEQSSLPASAERDADGRYFRGNGQAKVVLEQWSDFQCPACAAVKPALDMLLNTYGADIKLVYRHFPLSMHPQAIPAARAAEAAGLQGAFWPMADALLAHQGEMAQGAVLYERLAQEINIDLERYRQDVESAWVKDRVNADLDDAMRLRIPGTPSFVLNDKLLQLRTYADLENAVKEAIAASQ